MKIFLWRAIVLGLMAAFSVACSGGGGSDGSTPTTQVYPRFAYVANLGSNNVSQYTLGADGALTPRPTAVAAGDFPGSTVIVGSYQ